MASLTGKDEVLLTEVLLGGQMWSRTLRRGQRLRITDLEGGAALTALFYNARLLTERYNMPDTLKAQQIARVTRGNALYSDMGRVLCSIVADTVGWHDTITGFGNAALTQRHFGSGRYQELRNGFFRNTRDNLLIELGKYGLGKADISGNVNFFVKVPVDEAGNLSFVTPHSKAMDYVELRADLDVLIVLSNTPHPLDPARTYAPKPVRLQLVAGSPASADDFVRLACPENQRGFTLNDQYCL
ncbi:MAG TPA: urea amidolyase associated protein UAAP1 [Polyangiaceae bacterium]